MARSVKDPRDLTNVVFHPDHKRPYDREKTGRLTKGEPLPANVVPLWKPRPPVEATPVTLLLKELARALPPKALENMVTALQRKSYAGDASAYVALQIALGQVQ